MGLKEMKAVDKVDAEAKWQSEAKGARAKIAELRQFAALQDDPKFVMWWKLYVTKPIEEARHLHEIENDTNKSFTYKGMVRALRAQYGWIDGINKEIESLETRLYKDEEQENYSPEN